MKRPCLIIVVGYVIGIIVGLYFKTSIVLFYIITSVFFLFSKLFRSKNIKKLNIFSIKRYFRYFKLYLNKKIIITIIISSIISNTNIIYQNKSYEEVYMRLKEEKNIKLSGIVISDKQEKESYNKYIIKTAYNNKKIKLYIMVNKEIEFEYGDEINIFGKYIKPDGQRNYKGYDYLKYLKQLKIYGTIKCENIKKIKNKQGNKILRISYIIKKKIHNNVCKVLNEKESKVLLGLILGDKTEIDKETQENYINASMLHILSVSGMHITYILLGINFIFRKLIGKRSTNILSIIILFIYMFITNFSPSVTRAVSMAIIYLVSKIMYKKNDIYTSISISLFITILYNPFLIQNLGVLLSYGGVLGIVFLNKRIIDIIKSNKDKRKTLKYKLKPKIQTYVDKLIEAISITISVQIFIIPITIYSNNLINIYFPITNLFLSILSGPIIIVEFIFVILSLIYIEFAKKISIVAKIGIKILNYISVLGKLPLSKIYVPTPKVYSIIAYYLLIIVLFCIYIIYSEKNPNNTQIRIKNLIALIKINIRKNKKRVKAIVLFLLIILIVIKVIPQKMNIYFIDVGQGDSTFIVTPNNKTILIDGGGSTSKEFDIGKNTLVPYVLDRGFTKIDLIIVSHFDDDHVGGVLTVMEELKVCQVIISKQEENSENYKKFKEIVKEKKIKVKVVNKGDRLHIEKNIFIDILWPNNEKQICENITNNNSIVCKLHYKSFSMLFTGDIEEVAEKQILEEYKNKYKIFNSTVLKLAHHGSKTSSTQEFLELVNPKIALIGVGENNRFGHPNDDVLERLENISTRIYRTDINGEISMEVNNKGRIKIKKFIEG